MYPAPCGRYKELRTFSYAAEIVDELLFAESTDDIKAKKATITTWKAVVNDIKSAVTRAMTDILKIQKKRTKDAEKAAAEAAKEGKKAKTVAKPAEIPQSPAALVFDWAPDVGSGITRLSIDDAAKLTDLKQPIIIASNTSAHKLKLKIKHNAQYSCNADACEG